MMMNKMKFILTVFICTMLFGCATDSLYIQLTPNEDSSEIFKNNSETIYILPKPFNVKDIVFSSYNNKVSDSTYERLFWRFEGNLLIVERHTDNGVAGSSAIYEVEISTSPNTNRVTFMPTLVKKHQDGLILPYAVPQLDINSFLETTYYERRFEVDSKYKPEAIEGNLKRKFNNTQSFMLDNAKVSFSTKVYPYRDGSKSVFEVHMVTNKIDSEPINIEALYKQVELKLISVVNA